MIEVQKGCHEIVKNRSAWRILANEFYLEPIEAIDLVGRETTVVELVRWIRMCDCKIRKLDLVEVPVLHAPENIPPSLI